MSQNKKEIAIDYAKAFIGTWYKWAGDDPDGFDCSGLMVEVLKAVGLMPRRGDWTAHQLMTIFNEHKVAEPYEGCLVFWLNDIGKAIHVELCISDELAIGASGGGSNTVSTADAIAHNAFIKIRPIDSRAGHKVYVDPFKGVGP
jgi:cell wall-associated NlpC family hydrolase